MERQVCPYPEPGRTASVQGPSIEIEPAIPRPAELIGPADILKLQRLPSTGRKGSCNIYEHEHHDVDYRHRSPVGSGNPGRGPAILSAPGQEKAW